ncbi:MAG: leucine-rich repeat protein [Bacteroidales bacterium]|nr:leucine-rich repeat protein [Bacteroidales bacterium]
MKNLLSLLLALTALLASAEVLPEGTTFEAGYLTYAVSSRSTTSYPSVSVKGFSAKGNAETSLSLQIPTSVNYGGETYKVLSIDPSAFKNKTNITYLRINYGVLTVATDAFSGCSKLATVRIPSSVKYIYSGAFQNCSSLKMVAICITDPAAVHISPLAFSTVSGSTLHVAKTDYDALDRYKEHIAFKSQFTSIIRSSDAWDFDMFDGARLCVTKAPDKGVTGETAIVGFDGNSLSQGTYSHSAKYTVACYNYDVVEVAPYAVQGCAQLATLDLAYLTTLKTIKNNAFQNCANLTSVSLPTSLTTIGSAAFGKCTSLTSITVPKGVTSLSAYFVDGSTKLTAINVDEANGSYSSVCGVLFNKTRTKLMRCPEGFSTFTTIDERLIPASVITIGNYSFENCKKILALELPYGVKLLGTSAFRGCTMLQYAVVPSTVSTWNSNVFAGCTGMTTLFCNLAMPPAVGASEFEDLKRTRLFVPYKSMSRYKQATGWSTWPTVLNGAFDYFVKDVVKGPGTSSYRAGFTITSAASERIDGEPYDGRAMLSYIPDYVASGSTMEVNIPKHITLYGNNYAVTAVGSQVFPLGLSANTTVNLGENVDTIADYAFAEKAMLKAVKFGPRVTDIGVSAFYKCGLSGYIDIPYGVVRVRDNSFAYNNIEHLLVPSSAMLLDYAFVAGNKKLKELVVNDAYWSNYDEWDLTGIPTTCRLYVPTNAVWRYRNNSKWGKLQVSAGSYDFTYRDAKMNDTRYHMTVTSAAPVTKNGFTYDGKAKYVYHPAVSEMTGSFTASRYETHQLTGKNYLMTEFADSLLADCSGINEVKYNTESCIERIGERAFMGSGITSFEVPASCTSIGWAAFSYCASLKEIFFNTPATTCTWEKQFIGMNASDFKMYVDWREYSDRKTTVYGWTKYSSETNLPIARLNAHFKMSSDATTFAVDQPVDWAAAGINAYVVKSYDKNARKAITQKVTATPASCAVLLDGFEKNKTYKLQRPATNPSSVTNLLHGAIGANMDIYAASVGYQFNMTNKNFFRPTATSILYKGFAFLSIPAVDAGKTTTIEVDLWAQALKGDVNGDGQVNVSDVTALINKILGTATYADSVCDINADGQVNVSDVTALINLILG